MGRTLTLFFVLIALAIPASASAGHRHSTGERDAPADHRESADPRTSCDRPARNGYVTVANPNRVPMQVRIDGEKMGAVAAGDTVRFGPLEPGEHRIAAKYVSTRRQLRRRVLKEEIYVSSRHPTRIELPFLDMMIVELGNDWIEPMGILLDGRPAGTVDANGATAFLARDGATLTLVDPRGGQALKTRMRGDGLTTERLTLIPPRSASVLITNPVDRRLQLLDGNGRVLCDLAPWATERIRLPSGFAALSVRYRGRPVDSTRMIASPFGENRWNIEAPRTAQLTVDNDNRVSVSVFVDGHFVGRIGAHRSATFDQLDTGMASVAIEAEHHGRDIKTSTRVDLDPFEANRWAPTLSLHDGRGSRRASYDYHRGDHDHGYHRSRSSRSSRRSSRSTRWGW